MNGPFLPIPASPPLSFPPSLLSPLQTLPRPKAIPILAWRLLDTLLQAVSEIYAGTRAWRSLLHNTFGSSRLFVSYCLPLHLQLPFFLLVSADPPRPGYPAGYPAAPGMPMPMPYGAAPGPMVMPGYPAQQPMVMGSAVHVMPGMKVKHGKMKMGKFKGMKMFGKFKGPKWGKWK